MVATRLFADTPIKIAAIEVRVKREQHPRPIDPVARCYSDSVDASSMIIESARMSPIEILGGKIRTLRLEKGLSQEELAYRANLHRSYISQIERGSRNIAFENLLGIARALETTLATLTDGVS